MLKNSYLLLYLLITAHLNGQSDTLTRDTLTVVNYVKHVITDGKISPLNYVFVQKTYDIKNQLIKEIAYDDSSHQPANIAYIFNKDRVQISREEYNLLNNLKRVTRYSYNKSGRLIEENIYEPNNGPLGIKVQVKYYYSDTALVKKITYNAKKRWIEKSTIKFKPQQTIEKTVFARNYKNDGIKKEEIISLKTNDQKITRTITTTGFDGKKTKIISERTYRPGTLLLEKESNTNYTDSSIVTINYYYNEENKILSKSVLDKNNNYLERYIFVYTNYFRDPGRKEMVNLPE
jgi:hypothetical protein